MVGRTNVGGSGSSGSVGPAFAYIRASYPEGSICTATSGTKTITATDTSGLYVFPIPEPSSLPETWTLTCVDGSQQAIPVTVSIEAKYQVSSVQVKYGVPSTYYECEYIETSYDSSLTVGAYVDTGMGKLSWNEELTIVYDWGQGSYGDDGCAFGYSIGTGGAIRFGAYNGDFYVNGSKVNSTSISSASYGRSTLVVNNENHRITYQKDGGTIQTIASLTDPIESSANANKNIELFGVHYGTAGSYHFVASSIHIASYKRRDLNTGVLVQDFVPCYRKSDLAVGFYDLVNSEFHQGVNGVGTQYTQRILSYPRASY